MLQHRDSFIFFARRPHLARAAFVVSLTMFGASAAAMAQTPAPAAGTASSAGSQRGTVKEIVGSTLTLTTDAGKQVTVKVAETAKVLQIAPGSTDLKAATTIGFGDIAVGDRVLVTGKPGESAETVTASRVILMRSSDIAQKHAAEQADWNRRGSGGLVSAVDASTGTLTVSNGARKTQVATTGTTIFRRYAGDSVRFEDAQPGTVGQIQVGDQVRFRGARSEDGSTIQAEEIVSGSFRNLAGTVASINAGAGTLTLKDLATKKNVVVKMTANSDLRTLPAQAAAMFAMRAKGGGAAAGGPGAGGPGPGAAGTAGAGAGRPAGGPPSAEGGDGAGRGAGRGPGMGGGPGAGGPGMGGPRGAGMDLAQMISRLPEGKLTELKTGDALMIVASQTGDAVTAITVLSGVEPILAASPTGAAPGLTISPFGFGGGAPEGGGGGPQ